MKSFLTVVFIFFLQAISLSQKSTVTKSLVRGEIIKQKFILSDTNNVQQTLYVPSDRPILLYKYRGYNWFTDTKDSIRLLEDKISELLSSFPVFKNLKVICYSYNKDNFLSHSNHPNFKKHPDFTVEYYHLNDQSSSLLLNNGKLTLIDKKGKVLESSPFLANFTCSENYNESKTLKGKLLTEQNGQKIPLKNAKVFISNSELKDTSVTDNYGDFELKLLPEVNNPDIQVEPEDKTTKNIILATQEGVELNKFIKTNTSFNYRPIDAEIIRLTELPIESDLSQSFNEFLKTNERELITIEDVDYNLAKYGIDEKSKKILDKVANILMQNPRIKLEVVSHTDSQGDDKSNLELSDNRSLAVLTYLVLIGVDKSRIKPIGRGETQIRNRCKNGVDCSEKEHRYNRRTEFRFLKD